MHSVTPAGDGLILYIVTVVMIVLGWTTVITRTIVRQWIKQFGLDDALMVVGLILFTITCGLVIAFVFYGGGYRSADLSPETISLGTKYFFIAQIFYCSSTIPIKCSICIALLRIAGTRKAFRYTLFGIIGLTIASSIGTAIGIMNVCRPIPALWGEVKGTCDPTINSKVAYVFSAMCIIADWTLAILPAWILWNVQLKRRIRVSVTILLALGAFASCATVVRLRFLDLYDDPNEFLYASAIIGLWSIIELGIGIFAGSLAHLRPLLRFIPGLSKSSRGAESNDQNGVLGRRSGAMRMDTFSRTVVEARGGKARGKKDVETYKELDGGEDGDSQKHILDDGRRVDGESSDRGIKKVTEVTITGNNRSSDEAGYEPTSPLPVSAPALGRAVWKE